MGTYILCARQALHVAETENMSEDQVLILAPKALVTKLFEGATSAGGGGGGGGGEGVGFFNNDISLELSKGWTLLWHLLEQSCAATR